jgi:hypothetical protein
MARKILANLNFTGNEVQNVLVHVLATAPTALGAGQMYYDSTENRLRWYDGAQWNSLFTINDAGTATTDLWSADQIQSAINASVSGGVSYQGGYDANLNTPDLETPAGGAVLKGYMYTVTAAGTFFTEQVSIGDVLIAEVDDPASLADWTIVERNLNSATETSEGTTEIATQAEVDAGTDDFRYVTPLKLTTWFAAQPVVSKFAVNLDGAGEASVTRVFAGGVTTFTVNHALNTLDIDATVYEISTGEEVTTEVVLVDVNNVNIIFNGNKADGIYRVSIVG